MGKLDDRVAIITGCGRGFGEAMAKLFAKEGATVSISDIIPVDELESNVGSVIRSEGGRAICFQADASKKDQVNSMVEETIREFGTIDILVNNVGIKGPTEYGWRISLEDWKRTLTVNLDSMFLYTKAVLPEMIKKRGGE
jgi:NAD(P)-dependent dehydrogenase (short-subunit alcohol dehydrogenase family)